VPKRHQSSAENYEKLIATTQTEEYTTNQQQLYTKLRLKNFINCKNSPELYKIVEIETAGKG